MVDKKRYLDCLLESKVLQFGEFQTKSGRLSPYFINTGLFSSGTAMTAVAELYSDLIVERCGMGPHHLYGPAYKGIPLAVAVAMKLSERHRVTVSYSFNRKEAKGHGEGGSLVGRDITMGDSLIIVEDVMTGGTSVRESIELLRARGATVAAVVVGVDRQEQGVTDRQASEEITADFGIPVHSILTIGDILQLFEEDPDLGPQGTERRDLLGRISAYLDRYSPKRS